MMMMMIMIMMMMMMMMMMRKNNKHNIPAVIILPMLYSADGHVSTNCKKRAASCVRK